MLEKVEAFSKITIQQILSNFMLFKYLNNIFL